MWGPPMPLLTLLETGSYRKCSAATSFLKNTFTFLHPKTATISYQSKDNNLTFSTDFDAWNIREDKPIDGRPGIDYDFRWVFFCEEPLLMKFTPPYLHNTSDRVTATIASGQFDISKWFRPVNPSYLLWKDQYSITVTKDEPAFYIEFFTDKKVIFKQFELDEKLEMIAYETANFSNFFPFESLLQRYVRFIKGNRHKRVLNLIKNNLLE